MPTGAIITFIIAMSLILLMLGIPITMALFRKEDTKAKKYCVYFVGSHSTGKSTMVSETARELQMREIHIETNPSPRTFIPKEDLYAEVNDLNQYRITFGIMSYIMRSPAKVYITDRFLVDNIAYSWKSRKISGTLTDTHLNFLHYFSGKDSTNRQFIVFYLPIEFEMEKDGTRPEDVEYRNNIDKDINSLLDTFWPNYITLGGSVQDRMQIVRKTLENAGVFK